MNEQEDPMGSFASEAEQTEIQMQPTISINVSSVNNLELTVTKTCLEVLSNLGKAFSNAIKSTELKQIGASSPYRVQNDTGIPVTLCLDRSAFCIQNNEKSTEVILESCAQVPLVLKLSESSETVPDLKKTISNKKLQIKDKFLHIKVYSNNNVFKMRNKNKS